MKKKPLISVIIPVYNAEKYVERCIDSVLAQNYDNLEIICVNDGSDDESLKVLQKKAKQDRRIIVVSQINQGAAAARNKGLKLAKGEYISFIDADDYIGEGLYNYFSDRLGDGDLDVFMFNAARCDLKPEFNIKAYFFYEKNFSHKILPDEVFDYKSLQAIFFGNNSACNKIFSKKFLDDNKIRFLEGNHFEDLPFYFAIVCFAKRIKLTYDTYYFYVNENPNSVSVSTSAKVFEIFEVFDAIDGIAKKSGLGEFYSYALFQFKFEKIHEFIYKATPELKERFYNKAQKYLRSCATKLDKTIYTRLLHYSVAHNIMNTSFFDFWGTSVLSHSDYSFFDKVSKKPKFSIIVPIYNVEQYIGDCLRSLINQSFKDFEIICVNDGTPDNSMAQVEEFATKDCRIKIINQQNKGLGGARNTGVANANGEYLVFVDSDDWLHPEALEKLNTTVEKTKPDVCFVPFNQYLQNEGIILAKDLAQKLKGRQLSDYRQLSDIIFIYCTTWSKIYRRDFWKKHKFAFPEGVCFEDFYPSTKIMLAAKSIDFCPFNLYYYRIRENSIIQSKLSAKKIEDLFKAIEDCYVFLKKTKEFEDLKISFFTYVYNNLSNNKHKVPNELHDFYNETLKKQSFLQELTALLKKSA